MKPVVVRDEPRNGGNLSNFDAEEDLISFKPDWLKGSEASKSRTNDKWRTNGTTDGRRIRTEQRDWNKGSSASRERNWDRDRRSNFPGSKPPGKGRFIPPPMSRSQSAGSIFPPKEQVSQNGKELPPTRLSAVAVKNDGAFQTKDSDFPTLQPAASGQPSKKAMDMQNARSRFLKSKSTTALFDQNTPSKIEGNITALLGKAKTLEDNDIPAGYGEHHSADPTATPTTTTANETADVDTNHNATENDVPASQTKDNKSFPKLKKIPSFSEKLVETLVASQAAAKTETNQPNREEVEQALLLVPSKPAPPRLIKSRSDRGHLLDHVRKPATAKTSKGPDGGGIVAPPKSQPEIVQQPKPVESIAAKPKKKTPSPSMYRKATSEPQLLHLWNKELMARAASEAEDSSAPKKEAKSRVVDKQLELRQQRRNLFLEQLRKREAIKNGELVEGGSNEGGNGEGEGGGCQGEAKGEEEGECTAVVQFSEEAVFSFMKQLGWEEEEGLDLDEGLTEEEMMSVHLDSVQITEARERRREQMAQSLRQWQPTATKGTAKAMHGDTSDSSSNSC